MAENVLKMANYLYLFLSLQMSSFSLKPFYSVPVMKDQHFLFAIGFTDHLKMTASLQWVS